MYSISTQEWQLLSFFECEPELLDSTESWDCNDAVYRVADGTSTLSFAVHPAFRDVRIIVETDGHRIYELEAMGVVDVRYLNESGLESLEVVVDERSCLQLRVRPRIRIHHRCRIE